MKFPACTSHVCSGFRRRPALLICLGLCACTQDQMRVDMSVGAMASRPGYLDPTLYQAKRDFFGPDGSDPGPIGGGSGGSLFAGAVTMRGAPPSVASIRVTRRDPVATGLDLQTQVALDRSAMHARLPDGIGVLTDPMDVDIQAQTLRVQVALSQHHTLPTGWGVEYGAGLGLQSMTARSYFSSALIDLHSQVQATQSYWLLMGEIRPPRGPSVTGSLLVYPSGADEIRLGLSQSF